MKKEKIIFWIATGIFSAWMLFIGFLNFTSPVMTASYAHIGFPGYFKIEVGIAKWLGTLALVLPFVPKGFKYFAYSGFTIMTLSASIAHASTGDPFNHVMMGLLFLGILLVSFIYYEKLRKAKESKIAVSS